MWNFFSQWLKTSIFEKWFSIENCIKIVHFYLCDQHYSSIFPEWLKRLLGARTFEKVWKKCENHSIFRKCNYCVLCWETFPRTFHSFLCIFTISVFLHWNFLKKNAIILKTFLGMPKTPKIWKWRHSTELIQGVVVVSWLRRRPAKPLDFVRTGSNPVGVVLLYNNNKWFYGVIGYHSGLWIQQSGFKSR